MASIEELIRQRDAAFFQRDQAKGEAYGEIAQAFRRKESAHRDSISSPATTARGAEVFKILADEYGACAEDLESRAEKLGVQARRAGS